MVVWLIILPEQYIKKQWVGATADIPVSMKRNQATNTTKTTQTTMMNKIIVEKSIHSSITTIILIKNKPFPIIKVQQQCMMMMMVKEIMMMLDVVAVPIMMMIMLLLLQRSWLLKYDTRNQLLDGCLSVYDMYKHMSCVSKGTYGVIWKARDLCTQEIVALKQIKIDVGNNANDSSSNGNKEGFSLSPLREINLLLSLSHESIVTVKEMFVRFFW